HVVGTQDSDNKMRLYKNGVKIKEVNGLDPASTFRVGNRIGRSHWNDSYFDGQMDELRIYSTGLSQDDVNAIYGGGNGETPVTAPVITSAVTKSGEVKKDFLYILTTDTPNVVFGAYNLPPGLSISGAKISGKPLVGGTYSVTLTASTSAVTGTKIVTVTIPASPALVRALPATNVLASTARVNGEVVETGGDNPTVTLYFGATDANDDVDGWNLNKAMGVKSKEGFNVDLDSLFLNKTYFYRFKTTNSAGDSWSTVQSFTTLDHVLKPVLGADMSATDITGSRVTLNGSLISAGGGDTIVKIHWGDKDPGATVTGWDHSLSLGNLVPGKFSWDIDEGFAPPKVYHARYEAINSAGSTWSDALHFTALPSKSTKLTKTAVSDLAVWFNGTDIDADGSPDDLINGQKILLWKDSSGNAYDASLYRSDPNYVKVGSHGSPAINFDGDDSLYTTQKFTNILGDPGHTIFTIARYTGGDSERIFSTRDGRNWLFGYHGNTVKRWYSDGWITNIGGSDTAWHMHIGDIGPRGVGDPEANLWVDGQHVTVKSRGSNNNNTYPTDFQMGGYRGNNEYSKCEVSEVLMFSRVLPESDRHVVEGYLAHKYQKAGTLAASHPYKNEPPYFGAAAPDVLLPDVVKASVGNPWLLKIEANNAANSYSGYDLPSWLTVDGEYLKGTPTADGVFDITIAAANDNGNGLKKIKLEVTDFAKWPYSMDFTTKSMSPSDETLSLHWNLDEGSGTTATDLSGSTPGPDGVAGNADDVPANTGVLTGGTVVGQDGRLGKAFKFDGKDDKVTRTLPANTTYEKFTLSLWAKPAVLGQTTNASIFNSGNTGNDFQIDLDGAVPGEWRYVGDKVGTKKLGMATKDWTHIAVVCNGADTKLYFNGLEKYNIAGKKDNIFQHFQIGTNRSSNKFFNGLIDDVRIYTTDLSGADLYALADTRLKNFPVLVRLRDGLGGFSYKQVKSLKGGDIRFLSTSGNELPYSFDEWNSDGESDLWVSLDSVNLNGGDKFTMYWGNPDATAIPSYSTNGSAWQDYILVSHLGETNHIIDSSPQGSNGIGLNNVTKPTYGIIGSARTFTADNNSIVFPARDKDVKSLTASAWFYFTKVPGNDETFFYTKSWTTGDTRAYFHDSNADGPNFRYEVHSGNPSNIGRAPTTGVISEDDLNKWTHITTVYDSLNKRYTFYKNGGVYYSCSISNPSSAKVSTGIVLGANENGNWREMRSANIDQFEVSSVVRSHAWIKASIESATPGSGFLTPSNFDGPPEFIGDVQITGLIHKGTNGQDVSEAINFKVPIKGSADTITAVGLPAGLTLGNDGTISGTPLTGGTTPITLTATGKGVSVEKKITVRVVDTTLYTHTLTLSFPSYAGGTNNLENFPVLVELGTHLNNFSYNSFLTPEGGDLRFYDATPGSASVGRELNYEMEQWDPAGKSYAWVQVPNLTKDTKVIVTWANADDAVLPDYRFTGSTWSDGFAGVFHLPPVNFLQKFTDSSLNFAHGDDVSMPETEQSYISSAANFGNSQIDVPGVGSLGTVNEGDYSISLWAKLKGDITTGTPGLKEYIFNGSYNDTNIDPLDSGKGFLSGSVVPVSEIIWTANENINWNGGQINTRSGGKTGTDRLGMAWEGILVVGNGSPVNAGDISFGTRSDDGSVVWVDKNKNGKFDNGEMIVNNKGGHGQQNRAGNLNLAAGQYKWGAGFYEGGGGEYVGIRWKQGKEGDYNKMSWINPGQYNGMFLAPNNGMPLATSAANDMGIVIAPGNKPKFTDKGALEGASLTGSEIQKDQWNHIVGTVDRINGVTTLYVNGAQEATSSFTPGALASDLEGANWLLGSSAQANMELDEVRFSTANRSADWVKASFDNQKQNQSLVSYAEVTGPARISSNLSVEFTANTTSEYDIKATKNPAGFAALNLPGGMSVDLDTGKISGSPEVAGTFEVTLQVMYPDGSLIEETLTIIVKASAPEIAASAPTEVQDTNTKFNGTVTKTGGDFPSVFVYYGNEDGANDPSAWDHAVNIGRQGGAFSEKIGDLTPNSDYFYRLQASNSAGTVWDGSATWYSAFDGINDSTLGKMHGPTEINTKDKYLRLTKPINSQATTVYIPDLNPGKAIKNFNASFDLYQGPGSDDPADGVSFYFGPIADTKNLADNANENGLKIHFKIYQTDQIEIRYNKASIKTTQKHLLLGEFVPVSISISQSGRTRVMHGSTIIDTTISGWNPAAGWNFAFGGRTGGQNA
ncbi:MAG: DUF2341 domain-containing protein, partial [Opitutae bacterium]|nr:DUF2341 domain-containing protein [Opitutae bacterium]